MRPVRPSARPSSQSYQGTTICDTTGVVHAPHALVPGRPITLSSSPASCTLHAWPVPTSASSYRNHVPLVPGPTLMTRQSPLPLPHGCPTPHDDFWNPATPAITSSQHLRCLLDDRQAETTGERMDGQGLSSDPRGPSAEGRAYISREYCCKYFRFDILRVRNLSLASPRLRLTGTSPLVDDLRTARDSAATARTTSRPPLGLRPCLLGP